MFVAVLRLVLHLPGCRSLKEKRATIQPLLRVARQRFEVAAAEIGEQEAHGRAVLAFAVVSGSSRHAHAHLQRMERALCAEGPFRVLERDVRLHGEDSFEGAGAGWYAPGGWDRWAEEGER